MSKRRRVTQAEARRFALKLPGVVEKSHFGRPDFRVRNKIFATLPPDSRAVIVKLRPPDVTALLMIDGRTFWDEWRGRWLGVHLDRVKTSQLQDLLSKAWHVVAPKRQWPLVQR